MYTRIVLIVSVISVQRLRWLVQTLLVWRHFMQHQFYGSNGILTLEAARIRIFHVSPRKPAFLLVSANRGATGSSVIWNVAPIIFISLFSLFSSKPFLSTCSRLWRNTAFVGFYLNLYVYRFRPFKRARRELIVFFYQFWQHPKLPFK